MAKGARLMTAVGVAFALAACGKQGSAPSQPAGETSEAPPPAPAELTDAQKKALLAELPAAYRSADLGAGQAKFAVCRSCHTNEQGGQDMVGPNLWGVFGRKAGSKPGYSYSDDLKNAGWTWDADHIDKWITNPRAVLPGSKMTFIGLPDPTDRINVIAYLKVSTSPPPAGAGTADANAATNDASNAAAK